MEYDQIKSKFNKNDIIESLESGEHLKYSGSLTIIGYEPNRTGYDSFNEKLIVYKNYIFAKIIEHGIDQDEINWKNNINNINRTCNRLGCTLRQLLDMDYIEELKK